jgi:K+-transporting ATPase ATPase C chain
LIKAIKNSVIFLLITVIFCFLYTGVVTIIGQTFFYHQANGSMIILTKEKKESELLAQPFSEKKYLWGRNMIIDTKDFKTSGGQVALYGTASNLAQNSSILKKQIKTRTQRIKTLNNKANNSNVPIDLVTTSGSGLDPEISPKAAEYQVPRIAEARHIKQQEVQKVIDKYTKKPSFGILGKARVNVLKVNLALDRIEV